MSRDVNLHSQIVGWLKVLLPLAALMLLSTLFLFARDVGDVSDIPFAEIDQAAQDQRIGTPRFSGLTDTGDSLQINAIAAQPDPETTDRILIDRPRLTLDAIDGTTLRVASGSGTLNSNAGKATLGDLARIDMSNGYSMETAALRADLNSGIITSDGAMEIQAPFGQLTAGQTTIDLGQSGNAPVLLFSDGVRLVFQPAVLPEESP